MRFGHAPLTQVELNATTFNWLAKAWVCESHVQIARRWCLLTALAEVHGHIRTINKYTLELLLMLSLLLSEGFIPVSAIDEL